MQRISAQTHQVHALSSALTCREDAKPAVALVEEPVPDPMQELEQLRQETIEAAKEEGFRLGMQAAEHTIEQARVAAEQAVSDKHQAMADELSARIAETRVLLNEIPQAVEGHQRQLESALVEISFAAVLRIMGELHTEADLVSRLCRATLQEYRQRPATLHVSPEDRPILERLVDSPDLRIESDSLQKPGQLRLESMNGAYETGLGTRLEGMLQAFLGSLPEQRH